MTSEQTMAESAEVTTVGIEESVPTVSRRVQYTTLAGTFPEAYRASGPYVVEFRTREGSGSAFKLSLSETTLPGADANAAAKTRELTGQDFVDGVDVVARGQSRRQGQAHTRRAPMAAA